MSPERPRAWRMADGAVIVLLLAGIGLPLAGTVCRLGQRTEGEDMRRLAELPTLEWSAASLETLAQRVEDYVKDHFGFRGSLLRSRSAARLRILGVSPSAHVVLGHDSWLYYAQEPLGTDYEQVRPFTAAELQRWQDVLERRQEWLARRGCRYVLLLAPDKQTIYPEHLDPALRPRHASGRLEQLVEHLRRQSGVTVLDVRQPLCEASRREQTYRVRDSHWNTCGAFVGYRELAQVLSEWFPQVRPFQREQFEVEVKTDLASDLVELLGVPGAAPEKVRCLKPRFPLHARSQELPRTCVRAQLHYSLPLAWDNPDTSLPRAVLIHDSFGLGFCHWLAEHFQHMVSVWHDDFPQDLVEREKPDVVIHELVERKLGCLVPNDLE
jgi:alginate O-acetyltransferase complex protein AlgJ